MSQQQPEKLTARTKPEKPRPQQPFVQLEGKLTLEQYDAIARLLFHSILKTMTTLSVQNLLTFANK